MCSKAMTIRFMGFDHARSARNVLQCVCYIYPMSVLEQAKQHVSCVTVEDRES